MTQDNTKLVRFMTWLKRNRYCKTIETPSMVVHKYLSAPEDGESTQPMECFHIDGEGDVNDDFGSGSNGHPDMKGHRYCKGCHADVTQSMYCHCGDFHLQKSETLSEEELKKMQ